VVVGSGAAKRAHPRARRGEQQEGQWVHVDEILASLTSIFARIKARLLAIPAKIATRLIGIKTAAEAMQIVRSAIHEAIEEIGSGVVVPAKQKSSAA
jgi:hypothetical protein